MQVRIAVDPDPAAVHLFDATTTQRLSRPMTVASVAMRQSPVHKETSLRTRRRKEAGLAYLILLPALAVFGVFHLLSVLSQLQADALRNPTGAGAARALRRTAPDRSRP